MNGVIISSDLFKKIKKAIKDSGLGKELTKVWAIDISQAWFWSREWQNGEKRADDDLKKGRVEKFDSVGKLIKNLQAAKKS